MNKQELIDTLAKKIGSTKSVAEDFLNAFTEVVPATLKKGDSIRIMNFGTWEAKKRPASKGRNPRTGETIKIPACKQIKFTAGKGLKDAVN
ncbi:MAG: HU family DNA-binding protein [Alphaproteobacteria bacterium]|nr:HU family DNA-binding protein [Alphaproteobacteria bacterium]